jgi:hypothetical protein
MGAVRAAACLPLQCPPNIMMLSCDVSKGAGKQRWSSGWGRIGATRQRSDGDAERTPSGSKVAVWRHRGGGTSPMRSASSHFMGSALMCR